MLADLLLLLLADDAETPAPEPAAPVSGGGPRVRSTWILPPARQPDTRASRRKRNAALLFSMVLK